VKPSGSTPALTGRRLILLEERVHAGNFISRLGDPEAVVDDAFSFGPSLVRSAVKCSPTMRREHLRLEPDFLRGGDHAGGSGG